MCFPVPKLWMCVWLCKCVNRNRPSVSALIETHPAQVRALPGLPSAPSELILCSEGWSIPQPLGGPVDREPPHTRAQIQRLTQYDRRCRKISQVWGNKICKTNMWRGKQICGGSYDKGIFQAGSVKRVLSNTRIKDKSQRKTYTAIATRQQPFSSLLKTGC